MVKVVRTDVAYVRIYVPLTNEFLITGGESTKPTGIYYVQTITMGNVPNLMYHIVTVRGPKGAFTPF